MNYISSFKRWIALMLFSLLVLEVFFVLRIAVMAVIPVTSTAFERTAFVEQVKTYWHEPKIQASQKNKQPSTIKWQKQWVPYAQISEHMKRAVVASEDSRFDQHHGVEWEAIISAWQHNQKGVKGNATKKQPRKPSIRGGSTITQQLAKNLFLSTEQTYARKGQELFITYALEMLLSKQRVLELYLNHAQWGEGVYGVEAAAQHYYQTSAKDITAQQAAILAAMLPNPRYYEKHKNAPYLQRRARQIQKGMPIVNIP